MTTDKEENPAIKAFLNEVVEVCKKHNLSIGHEDEQGTFIVHPYGGWYTQWLLEASDYTDTEKGKAYKAFKIKAGHM